jgi:hypothetical protein
MAGSARPPGAEKSALLAGAAADAAVLERVLALPRAELLLLFRQNVGA